MRLEGLALQVVDLAHLNGLLHYGAAAAKCRRAAQIPSKREKTRRHQLKRLARPAMIVDVNVQIQLHQQIQGGDHEIRFDRCKCHIIGVSTLG